MTSDDNIIDNSWTVEAGGTLNMEAGILRSWTEIAGVLNISGGGDGASNQASGPIVSGGVLNLSGGVLGTGALTIHSGAVVNQTGGDLGLNTDVESGGVLNISGGTFGTAVFDDADLDVQSGGTVNFTGTEFSIDGNPIPGLTLGTTVTITDRGMLTGTFLDGSPVNFDLDSDGPDSFNAGSTLTVTLGSPFLLGDVNLDGMVTFFDISPFIAILADEGFQDEADIDRNSVVNFFDISPFIEILAGP